MITAGSFEATTKRSIGRAKLEISAGGGGGGAPRPPPGANGGAGWNLLSLAGEIEAAVGLVDVHRPTAGADQPGNGNAAAEIAQIVAARAAHHALGVAAAVELRAAFAQAQNRALRRW